MPTVLPITHDQELTLKNWNACFWLCPWILWNIWWNSVVGSLEEILKWLSPGHACEFLFSKISLQIGLELLKCNLTDMQLFSFLVPGLTLCSQFIRHLKHEVMFWSVKKFAEIIYWVTRDWCEFYLEETTSALYFKADCFETWNYRHSVQNTNHTLLWMKQLKCLSIPLTVCSAI